MVLLVVLFVLAFAVPIAAGVYAHRRGLSVAGGLAGWADAVRARTGPVAAAVLVLVAGYAITIVVGLALGFLAKSLQSGLDEPVFHWVHSRVSGGSEFTKANAKLTLLGDNPITQLVAFIAAIVLGFAYRRRWWLPVGALAVAYVGEKYAQKLLGKIVDRGHPPTTLGTYPSGGVGRLLAIYGTIVVLILVLQPTLSRAWRAGLWTGVATAAVVEAFTRVYLSKHWFTDALFGLVFGTLLLLTNATAVLAMVSGRSSGRAAPAARATSSRTG